MRIIGQLRNPIQGYAWGSNTAIRGLFGNPEPSSRPEAELWLGAHPKAPSEIQIDGQWHRLDAWLASDSAAALGAEAMERFGTELPFLFKVLAAGAPLSIQAHPNAEEARVGFDDEERRGIPRDAAERTYRDPSAKPELIYALTPFWMLRGLRPAASISLHLERMDVAGNWPAAAALLRNGDAGRAAFVEAWLRLRPEESRPLIARAADRAATLLGTPTPADPRLDPEAAWLLRLAADHPDDPGTLAPLILDTYALAPGEAVFTGPGVLHAYLEGLGLEVMASSDNVLRGGLTPKHVDADALLGILDWTTSGRGLVTPLTPAAGVQCFAPAGAGFRLTAVDLSAVAPDHVIDPGLVAVVLATDGVGELEGVPDATSPRAVSSSTVSSSTVSSRTVPTRIGPSSTTAFTAADSFLVAGAGGLTLRGTGTVYIAGC